MVFKLRNLIKRKSRVSTKHSNNYDSIVSSTAQHIGCRKEQQDSFGLSDLNNIEFIEEYGVLAVIADGMGGLHFGKDASEIAVKTMVNTFINKSLNESNIDALVRALYLSNENVIKLAKSKDREEGVGTTLIAANIYNDKLNFVSVGDSRIYLYRNNKLKQLNKEHIYLEELKKEVLLGKRTLEEAINHQKKDYLTSYIGLNNLSLIDKSKESLTLYNNDIILLCTDGLFKSLTDEEIKNTLLKFDEKPLEISDELIKEVIKKNYKYQDNVTVIALKYFK